MNNTISKKTEWHYKTFAVVIKTIQELDSFLNTKIDKKYEIISFSYERLRCSSNESKWEYVILTRYKKEADD